MLAHSGDSSKSALRILALPVILFGKAFDPPLVLFTDINHLVNGRLKGIEVMKGFNFLAQSDR